MDPDKLTDMLMEKVRKGDFEMARAFALDLRGWLERGGFVPQRFGTMLGFENFLEVVFALPLPSSLQPAESAHELLRPTQAPSSGERH